MKDIDLFEVITQVLAFIGTQDPQRQADQGPQVNHLITTAIIVTEFVDLGMAVVTGGNAVISTGGHNLIVFKQTVLQPLFFIAGLQKTAATAAAIIVGAVGKHIDKIFFSHEGLNHEAQILGYGIPETFAYDLTGILNRKLDF
jgi:hypothetical protein